MIGLVIFAGLSAFVLLCGLLSFSLMFSDVAPSQNEYCWPYLIPAGLIGLAISGVAALVRWLA